MTETLPPGLVDYLAARDQQRADRADTAWRTLRPFERRLVREAAVMGFVLGDRAGLTRDDEFPRDMDIVRNVLEHCDSTSDKFPYLGAACSGRRRRITKARMWPGEAS